MPHKLRLTAVAWLFTLLWSRGPAACGQGAGAASGEPQPAFPRQMVRTTKGIMLRGQVEHSTTLPPADPDLYPGASFNEGKAIAGRARSQWYQIPDWFAGEFHVDRSTIAKIYDFRTGETRFLNQSVKAEGEETRGQQRDAEGHIWNLYTTAGSSKSEHGSHITYNDIQWYGPEEINDERVVMRVLATSILVDKATGAVVQTVRREDIKTYVPLRKGVVGVSYTSKGFNLDGSPNDLQTGFSTHRLAKKFQPVDHVGDTDLRKLFRDYLLAHRLPDLVPKDLRN